LEFLMAVAQEVKEDQGLQRDLLAEGFDHAYIHEGALGDLALSSELDATDVFMFMGSLRLRAVVGNILGPGGEADYGGAWNEGEAEGAEEKNPKAALKSVIDVMAGPDERRFITPFLRQTAVSVISGNPAEASITERLVPIGGPIVDQCFEQDYLTYGFDADGAGKMRSESGPMHEWTAALGTGEGPADLAIVHGPNGSIMRGGQAVLEFNAVALSGGRKIVGDYLVPALPDIGAGGVMEYVRQRRPAGRLPLEEVQGLDRAMRTGIVQVANARISQVTSMLDSQRSKIGSNRYEGRLADIEKLRHEVARVVGRHALIRERFYT
jgi:hypothetical protein